MEGRNEEVRGKRGREGRSERCVKEYGGGMGEGEEWKRGVKEQGGGVRE